ncbi:MAG: hypothetical protein J2P30_01120 [Actinobacteria bacterium]|nr:hypothetical protein [Actinomycetota bacterium]
MPLFDVTYDGKVGEEILRRLGDLLPDVVAEAVECPEEHSTGPVRPGDIEIRFRKKSPLDTADVTSAWVIRAVARRAFPLRVMGIALAAG